MISYEYFFKKPLVYIKLIEEILALNLGYIEFVESDKNTAYMTTVFSCGKYFIKVNFNLTQDERTFIACLTHELRHIYQHECVTNNYTDLETEETISGWKISLNSYNDSTNKNYDMNLLEVDANAFTKRMIELIFNDNSFFVRIESTPLFIKTYDYICDCFTKDDIDDCLNFLNINNFS